MKALFLTILISLSYFANANEIIESTTRPEAVSPGMITFFSDEIFNDTYVSVVATLVGGAWLHQAVSVSIGYQEEAQETFTIEVAGEVLSAVVTEDLDGNIGVTVTTGSGPFNSDLGQFDEGYTKYYLSVKTDENTDNLYSNQGTLTRKSFKLN